MQPAWKSASMATCSSTFMPCTLQSPSVDVRYAGAQPKASAARRFTKISSFPSIQLKKGVRRQPMKLSISAAMEVPDFLPATWTKRPIARPIGPSFELTAEDAVLRQLDALQINDQPYPDHGVEVMYRFAGFDPFQRSTYFGPTFDLGQFERFRRIFHHSTYRVLLCHQERELLSNLFLDEELYLASISCGRCCDYALMEDLNLSPQHCFKQRVRISGARPGEEEIFEFTLVQRVGGNWDGYWLTDSLHHDGKGITGGIAY